MFITGITEQTIIKTATFLEASYVLLYTKRESVKHKITSIK